MTKPDQGAQGAALPPEVAALAGSLRDADLTAFDALAVPIAPGGEHGPQPRIGTADAALRYGIDLGDLAELTHLTGKAGELTVVPLPRLLQGTASWGGLPRRLVLIGVGDESPRAARQAGAALARAGRGWDRIATTAYLDDPVGDATALRAFVEAFWLASHRAFRAGRPLPASQRPACALGLITPEPEAVRASIAHAQIVAEASGLARTWSATPAAVATPDWLAEQVARLGEQIPGLEVQVHGEEWLGDHGLRSVLAVAAGAATAPRFVVATWCGDGGRDVAIVGKGITYDTGGLALKPRESMVSMKTDMAGAAAALATVVAAARLGVAHRVTAVAPLAENAIGGGSYRPGDVVQTWDGTHVAVGNTDAEGRMVLADAIAWSADQLDPDVIVDIATLTGAASLGLGKHHGALFTDDDALAIGLLAAGELSGEALWRLPLVEDYREALTSDVADLAQVASDPHLKAGAIFAALFLQHFAHGATWAHLDIAGPARSAKARHELPEGATGFGVRVLTQWLLDLPGPDLPQ